MHRIVNATIGTILVLATLGVEAQQSRVGNVESVNGRAIIERGDVTTAATADTALRLADSLESGPRSGLRATLSDGSSFEMGEDTRVTLVVDGSSPSKPNGNVASILLERGNLSVTGASDGRVLLVRTPFGVIRTRSARLSLELDPNPQTGRLQIENGGGPVEWVAGGVTSVIPGGVTVLITPNGVIAVIAVDVGAGAGENDISGDVDIDARIEPGPTSVPPPVTPLPVITPTPPVATPPFAEATPTPPLATPTPPQPTPTVTPIVTPTATPGVTPTREPTPPPTSSPTPPPTSSPTPPPTSSPTPPPTMPSPPPTEPPVSPL